MTAETAAEQPFRTILSGPAGGVNGALLVCRQSKVSDFITCDMGGTSTDVSLVQNLSPSIISESMIAGIPLKLQQLDINTVGAGGGSIAYLDIDGGLRVGPRSAGAIPGPACYGRGGTEMTVTDADFLLGRLGEATLLGGKMKIDRAACRSALKKLMTATGYDDGEHLAEGVVRIAVARMVSAIREISIERGHDPRRFTLIPCGGAGPLHGAEIAEELGIVRILVPLDPGNLSAFGLTGANLRYDYVHTRIDQLTAGVHTELMAVTSKLAERGRERLTADGFESRAIRIETSLDLRYRGQAFELVVPFETVDDLNDIHQRFEKLYSVRYGFKRTEQPIEVVTVRVVATGIVPQPTPRHHVPGGSAKPSHSRDIYWRGKWRGAAIYDRNQLPSDTSVAGPTIIEEFGSTTFVPPGWLMRVDPLGNLRMEPRQ
jgi:N-methylhydantoinase A